MDNSRILSGLDPVFRDLITRWISSVNALGIEIRLLSGYRSSEEQNWLFAQGRTRAGNIVTNAPAGFSAHNHGIAVDFACYVNGILRNDLRKNCAQIAKALGCVWGGDWVLFYDAPHIEYTQGNPISYFQNGGKLTAEPVTNISPKQRLTNLINRAKRVQTAEGRSIISHVIERLKGRLDV